MTDKEQIIIDGDLIKCPCYINKPLYRYDKGCLIQSQAFKEQQTEKKPILRCDEIENCPIKEQYKQLARKTQECEQYKKWAVCFKDVNKQLGYKYLIIKQECEELKQSQEDAEKVLKNILDNFDKMENHYRNAINKIEKYIKKYEPTGDDEFALIEYKNLRDILVIINKVKGEQNGR